MDTKEQLTAIFSLLVQIYEPSHYAVIAEKFVKMADALYQPATSSSD